MEGRGCGDGGPASSSCCLWLSIDVDLMLVFLLFLFLFFFLYVEVLNKTRSFQCLSELFFFVCMSDDFSWMHVRRYDVCGCLGLLLLVVRVGMDRTETQRDQNVVRPGIVPVPVGFFL